VIKCTKINLSEKLLSSVIVAIANAKGCVHGYRIKCIQEGALRDFSKVFSGGGLKWWNSIFPIRN